MKTHRKSWYIGLAAAAVLIVAAVAAHRTGGSASASPSPFGARVQQFGSVPPMMNYQGYLTSSGNTPKDGAFTMTFRIYADSTGGAVLWEETHQSVSVIAGIFNVLLGSAVPLPSTIFDGGELWLETEVESVVLQPRRPLVSVPYSIHAQTADVAMIANTRDTYHEVVDVMPNTGVKMFVIPKSANAKVTLYLHGEGFNGGLLAHTHSGTNVHDHAFSVTSGAASTDHTHGFSATTSGQSNDHVHSGTTSAVDLSHNHGGVVTTAGTHRHTLAVDGVPGSGIYLVQAGNVNGLSASNTPDRTLTGSIELDGSHTHGINSDLGSHSHTFGTGGVSANHSHSVSGTTGGASATHTHSVSGTTASSGSGLGQTGVAAGTLPTNVRIYVDGAPVSAGPFSGQFSSGAIDLSAFITDNQEHSIEFREEGGTGGRIIYTIFVEYAVAGAALASAESGGLVLKAVDGPKYFLVRVSNAGVLLPPEEIRHPASSMNEVEARRGDNRSGVRR